VSPILESIGSVKGFGWGAFAESGTFESIATVTVAGGGSANVEFTGIPSTYTHLQLRYIFKHDSTETTTKIQLNSDTGNNYTRHRLTSDGSSVSSAAATSTSFIGSGSASGTANIFSVAVLDILDYTNTNKYKTLRLLTGFDTNGGGSIQLLSSLWMNTNAITSIKFFFDSGNFAQYSHFALYGIKGA
jgi:hypothetical protein